MKKLILAAVCFVGVSFASQAQEFFDKSKPENNVTLGVRAGLNLSTISDMQADYRAGFNVGVSADFGIFKSLYINSGLYFSMKGANCDLVFSDGYMAAEGKLKMNPMYLEIPVMASYRYNFNEDTQWQLNFGPWFAFGIAGDVTGEASIEGYKEEESLRFFDAGGNHFDMGLALGTGVTYRKFFVGINYQFGLTHAISTEIGNPNTSNFSISLGYNFHN